MSNLPSTWWKESQAFQLSARRLFNPVPKTRLYSWLNVPRNSADVVITSSRWISITFLFIEQSH
jgi:hypothetical protein